MKNNKVLTIILLLLISITLVGVIVLVMIWNSDVKSLGVQGKSIDEIVESSVEVPEITTNLANDNFIKISFAIQTDSKKGKEELEKRIFQVNNIIITELSELTPEQFEGKKGKENLQEKLKTRIDSIMQEGTIENVYITSSIIQ